MPLSCRTVEIQWQSLAVGPSSMPPAEAGEVCLAGEHRPNRQHSQ